MMLVTSRSPIRLCVSTAFGLSSIEDAVWDTNPFPLPVFAAKLFLATQATKQAAAIGLIMIPQFIDGFMADGSGPFKFSLAADLFWIPILMQVLSND